MSLVTHEILEKMKTLTLLEATELVSQIEETFGVDASRSGGVVASGAPAQTTKTTFDVILESVAEDKRVSALKLIRSLTNLGLKEAKDFCGSLPKAVKEDVSKEEAEGTKKELEGVGGQVSIK